ncbi:MAG TPA: gas vesicle structural protein GvpA [Terriglobales bacterium]
MAVERISGGSSLIDVLDRVLDKGIVIDAWVRISLVGIDLITVEARVVVASIDTYLKYADIVGLLPTVARPQLGTAGEEEGRLGSEEEEGPRRPPRTPARRAARR